MFFGGNKNTGQEKNHGKVVAMDNFRAHVPVSALRQAEAYWTALRRGDDVPNRSQIDPRGLENILSQTFILERVAPGIARFRLAGQKVNEMAGMEVRGMPITAFFTPDARKQMSAALEHMFEAPAVVEIEMQTEATRMRGPQNARMLLLPLRSDLGDVSRALGVFVSEGNPTGTSQRFTINSIEMRAVTKVSEEPGFKAHARDQEQATTGADKSARTEGSFLQEARKLLDEKNQSNSQVDAKSASQDKKRPSHLRLVISRD